MTGSPLSGERPRATPLAERAALPDVLRGAALLSILCVNAQDFAGYSEWQQRGLDRAAQVIIDLLLNGKSISLFAMLFGVGAFRLLERGGRGLLLRRLTVLLLVGAAHYLLIWHGDIIANYAVVGAALLLLERVSWRTLAWLGAAAGGWWIGGYALLAAVTSSGLRGGAEDLQSAAYWGLVQVRSHEFVPNLGNVVSFDGFLILALFCFGGALYRSGLLWWPQQHRRALRWMLGLGTFLGLPLSAALAYSNTLGSYRAELWGLPLRFSGGLALAFAYIGAAGLLTASGKLGPLRVFAASGRLAMSNYLTQSLIMTTLFYPYGLNLYGKVGAFAALLSALAIGAAQVWASNRYLRRFKVGPLEWLVRKLVYGWRPDQRP